MKIRLILWGLLWCIALIFWFRFWGTMAWLDPINSKLSVTFVARGLRH